MSSVQLAPGPKTTMFGGGLGTPGGRASVDMVLVRSGNALAKSGERARYRGVWRKNENEEEYFK